MSTTANYFALQSTNMGNVVMCTSKNMPSAKLNIKNYLKVMDFFTPFNQHLFRAMALIAWRLVEPVIIYYVD